MGELGVQGVFRSGCAVHRRVAGAGRRTSRPARSRNPAGIRRLWPDRAPAGAKRPRIGLAAFFALALSFFVAAVHAQVVSTRIWPARDYTRVTIESKNELKYTLFALKNPERLVLDFEGAEMSPALAELHGKVATGDPYIEKLRVGRNKPGVLRVVLDLKTEVNAQAFTLKPIADYGHRLVLDLYPLVAPDPLALLIEQTEKAIPQPADTPAGPNPAPSPTPLPKG